MDHQSLEFINRYCLVNPREELHSDNMNYSHHHKDHSSGSILKEYYGYCLYSQQKRSFCLFENFKLLFPFS